MSYSVCPNCGQKALTVATRCPHCGVALEAQFLGRGEPVPKRRGIRRAVLVVGAVLLMLAVNEVALRLKVPAPETTRVTPPAPAAVEPVPAPVAAESVSQASGPTLDSGSAVVQDSAARLAQAETTGTAPPPAPMTAPAAAPPPVVADGRAAGARRYANTWVNVRAEPRNSAAVLRILRPGDAVVVDSLTHGWYRVLLDGAPEGYADYRFLDSVPGPVIP